MKHIYTPFLAIFLFFVIIGFSIYKQLENTREGLENMDPSESNVIITRNKHKVRRRKKSIKVDKATSRPYRENFNLGNFLKDKIGGPIKKGFDKFTQFFKAIGSHMMCGFGKIKSLPNCMQWYLGEVIGKIMYFPIKILVAFGKFQKFERMVWRQVEMVDRNIYRIFGFHVIHYPDYVVKDCYKCKNLTPFPK